MGAIQDYDKWLHREANRVLTDPYHPLHDDLVQEGRIAMWKQTESLGREHAGFMTQRATQRMRNVRNGEKAFGGVKVAVRDVQPVFSIDGLSSGVKESLTPQEADLAERAMWAYHHGEIAQALNDLSPRQREAAEKVLTDGVMTPRERASWVDARKKLSVSLSHLRGSCNGG